MAATNTPIKLREAFCLKPIDVQQRTPSKIKIEELLDSPQHHTACPLCLRALTPYSPERRKQHVTRCIDSEMLSQSVGIDWNKVPLCPSCDKPFNSFTLCSKLIHLRQCGLQSGKSPRSIVQIVKDKVTRHNALLADLSQFSTIIEQPKFINDNSKDVVNSAHFFEPNQNSPVELKSTFNKDCVNIQAIKIKDGINLSNINQPKLKSLISNEEHIEQYTIEKNLKESVKTKSSRNDRKTMIFISSDDDFASEKIHQRVTSNNSRVFNKNNISIAKAMSLSLNQSIPLEHAEVVPLRRKRCRLQTVF